MTDSTLIVSAQDGNLWFTELNSNRIGRITVSGAITEFPLPQSGSGPFGIASDGVGRIWFTEVLGNRIGMFFPLGGEVGAIPVLDSRGYALLSLLLALAGLYAVNRVTKA